MRPARTTTIPIDRACARNYVREDRNGISRVLFNGMLTRVIDDAIGQDNLKNLEVVIQDVVNEESGNAMSRAFAGLLREERPEFYDVFPYNSDMDLNPVFQTTWMPEC
ncbi:hypothetical protein FPOAC2_03828 [Fusarium poae]|uniref:hypothetical protein n=1 Tax=Fusarium poae TaxID=36050 RepID=UPI001CE8AABE|nr:hypothetical protein FPOAC1_003720 [Fusarium poae]KAG8677692.1 hypothetical protein FPOAC1_003720 [Fusarium poae]